ncbi:MAG TPA: glycosyl hydrolase [Candidatus Methylomirabilis sp.]|nr:glycosyl hydrolase [Candidatus Methylomirabilis sp.]
MAPPDTARMWTWWFWLADRVDKESITADLEELKAKGIGGVTVYSLSGPGIDPSA